jgi:microcystin-dependent protein
MKLLRTLILPLALSAAALFSAADGQVPQIINYQGRIASGGSPFTGTGQFKFALVSNDGTSTFWSNDASSTAGGEPTAAVALPVASGLYVAPLGDPAIPGMTPLPATVFANPGVKLRVWFDDGTNGSQLLAPDQRVLSVAYAMMAAGVQDSAITSAMIAPGAVTSDKLAADSAIPPGTVVAFAGAVAPSGWSLCDGSSKSKTDPVYQRLFTVIGTSHGGNSTNFNLPDYRGRFLRGVDGTNSRDPDRNSRTAMNAGGNTGNQVGSLQGYSTALPLNPFSTGPSGEHAHGISLYSAIPRVANRLSVIGNTNGNAVETAFTNLDGTHSHTIAQGGDSETRPVNAYVHYIIKL